jgi:membrane-bound serine protease (ClpP class)
LAGIALAVIALLGPKIKIFDRLTLKTNITGTAGGPITEDTLDAQTGAGITASNAPGIARETAPGLQDYGSLVGKIGVTVTPLRPSGRVEIDGEVYSAEADGSFVEPGRGVKITRVRGSTITVRLV